MALWLLHLLTIALSAMGTVAIVIAMGRFYTLRVIQKRVQPQSPAIKASDLRLPSSSPGSGRVVKVFEMLSRLSVPEKGWQDSAARLRFVQAGYRQPNAARMYYAIKTALVLAVGLLGSALMHAIKPDLAWGNWLMALLSGALLTNYLPDLYLRIRTTARTQRMKDALPDLLDLLVICSESGLGLDAAITKIARDMASTNPEIAEEFYIMGLEIRAGEVRSTAMRNLALRINLDDLNDLVSMLIQADRFGTSLANSLRIQSEVMRNKRMQRAEEMAAKVPTKMLVPLVLFIFPVLMMVLLGPAIIQLGKVFT